jgi:hypothetical protein
MVLDGFWLFAWTRTGMVCVIAWLAMVALPVLIASVFSIRYGWEVTQRTGFPCAIFLALSLNDSMFNYFGEPHVMLCVGVVTAWARELLTAEEFRRWALLKKGNTPLKTKSKENGPLTS